MRDSEDTPIESPLGGYRAVLREVTALRTEVQRLRTRVTTVLVAIVIMIVTLAAATWSGQ